MDEDHIYKDKLAWIAITKSCICYCWYKLRITLNLHHISVNPKGINFPQKGPQFESLKES